jgi:glutamyl-tRNA synthetase
VRFDDTNPERESADFQDSIMADIRWLGIAPDKITYTSDSFPLIHRYALNLINEGKAFADDTPAEQGSFSVLFFVSSYLLSGSIRPTLQLKATRKAGRAPSTRRDMSVRETLSHFNEMATGSEEGQRWCIRARIQWNHPNGTMRDPVIYRCQSTPTGQGTYMYP